MKKITACLCAAALAVGVSACGNQTVAEYDTTHQNETLTGQVQEVTGMTVTLLLGDLTTEQTGSPGQPPEKPDGVPEADGAGIVPDGTDPAPAPGETERGGEAMPPAPFDGKPTEGSPPAKPGEGADVPFELGGGRTVFTAGEETVTLTVAEGAASDLAGLKTGDVVQIETGGSGEAVTITVIDLDGGAGMGGPGGSGAAEQGTAAYTIAADGEFSNGDYSSAGDDENALRIDGASVTLKNITVDKSAGSSSNVESGDFYGMNAALLATNGAEVTISGAHVTSDAQNGNGVFSYGEGTVVNISDSEIKTAADNSGGIQTTGGGTTNANDLTVTTQGNSSAAIRSDRGGGTVHVEGGSFTSNGLNSPAVYSTADINVTGAALTANNSEALVIEGRNSISLTDCAVSGNMSADRGNSSKINVHNVMIYQSMSGDAEDGTAAFAMRGGSLTGNSGDLIYVTNTRAVIELTGVEIENKDADGVLLRVSGNDASLGWGTAGENGGQVTLKASDQTLEGDIVVDSVSALDMTLADGSSFTGTVRIVDNEDGGAAEDSSVSVTVGAGSVWTLTGDCVITSLDVQGTINYNGHTITLADGTVLVE